MEKTPSSNIAASLTSEDRSATASASSFGIRRGAGLEGGRENFTVT